MASLRHIHTYRRHETRPEIMRCAHPECSHFTERATLDGKASICNICGSEFVLSKDDLRRTKPRCFNCSTTQKARQFQNAASLMASIIQKVEGPKGG